MKDCVNQELISLSAMLGYEAAPLHFIHFPKLWLEVYNTPVTFMFDYNNNVNTNTVLTFKIKCVYNLLSEYRPEIYNDASQYELFYGLCRVSYP